MLKLSRRKCLKISAGALAVFFSSKEALLGEIVLDVKLLKVLKDFQKKFPDLKQMGREFLTLYPKDQLSCDLEMSFQEFKEFASERLKIDSQNEQIRNLGGWRLTLIESQICGLIETV